MNFTVKQENFAKAVVAAGRASSTRSGLPILANILLRTDNNRLLVAATNLEISSATHIGAKITQNGEITVPAKILVEYVSNLPKQTVEITVKNNNLTLVCGGYTSTIRGMSSEEFPELPVIDEKQSVAYELNVADFKQSMNQVLFACSSDTTRPVLTGVYWHSKDGNLYVVGTDGYRLTERRITATDSNLAAIVPASTLQEVLRVLHDDVDMIEVLFDETQVRFRVGDNEITSRLIDGKYPDYSGLIPKSNDINLHVKVSDIGRTTKVAAIFARDIGGSIILESSKETQSVTIRSVASEIGENSSQIDAKVDNDGTVSLNSRFLSEALNSIDTPDVDIAFNGKMSPVILTPTKKDSDHTHIIMPLKS